jgi:hypothetical protein
MTDTATARPKQPWEITRDNRAKYMAQLTEKWGGLGNAMRKHLVRAEVVPGHYRLAHILERVAKFDTGWEYLGEAGNLIPLDMRQALGHTYGLESVKATLFTPPYSGQSGGDNFNVVILCEPYWYGDDHKFVEIEVGCKHEWTRRNLGRCYNEYKCSVCGAWTRVDSGD